MFHRFGKIDVSIEINGDHVDVNLKAESHLAVQVLSEGSSSLNKLFQNNGLILNNFNLNNSNQQKNFNKEKKNKKVLDNVDAKTESVKLEEKKNTNNLVYIKA